MNFYNISSEKGVIMDNVVKFKLSQYKDIRQLNDEGTVVLCYNIPKDNTCVKKIVNKQAFEIYKQLADIKSDFLPEIYEMFEYEDNYIIFEEYIKGKSLEQIINEREKLSLNEAEKYILNICDALEKVHSKNIIHRDISPDNVIISNDNKAVLLDFDIARVGGKNKTTDTTILGTAGFASPEQYGFAQTDIRSDIYSLGVLFNYMITGNIIQNGIYDEYIISEFIKKATNIDANLRFNSINSFRIALINAVEKSIKKELRNVKNNLGEKSIKEMLSYVPGFRTDNPVKKYISVSVYIFLVLIWISSISSGNKLADIFYFSLVYLYFLVVPMWWFGNNGKFFENIPIIRNFKRKNIAGIILYLIILVILALIIPDFDINTK